MTLPITELKKAVSSFLDQTDFSDKKHNELVSFAYKLNEFEFTPFIDTILSDNQKVFYFNRPEENLIILAFGNAFSVKPATENNFTSLEKIISVLTKNRISNFGDSFANTFPLLLGGSKFCSGKNSEEWKDFTDNDWFIPHFLFYKKDSEFWLNINFFIHKVSTSGNQLYILLNYLERLNNKEIISINNAVGIKLSINNHDQDNWNKLISTAVLKIKEGLFRKVVLSRRIITSINNSPLFSRILQQLTGSYNNCTIFLYASGNSVLFGATPEQLLKFRDDQVEFDALAGSAKRGKTEEEDEIIAGNLLLDKKNTEEHLHVIEFIKDESSNLVKNLRQFDTRIKKFSNIQHIYTPIKAELNTPKEIYNLVDKIFPTPAICGLPKESSLNYIKENEEFDRGLYSGIIGIISPAEMDLVVAIRSALLKDNKLYIYAGCGIVKDSNPQSEFEETEIKMNPILSLFHNEN
jgi:menaquinone-specific isochorismate synthase